MKSKGNHTLKVFSLIFFIILSKWQIALAQKACESLFLNIYGFENNYFNHDVRELFNVATEPEAMGRAVLLQDHSVPFQEKIIFVSEQFKHIGIDYKLNQYQVRLTKKIEVVIQPNEQSELNRLAKTLYNQFGIQLVYNPELLNEQFDGLFSQYEKKIYLSNYTAATGRIDMTLLHEIRHAMLFNREDRGLYSMFNGFMMNWRGLNISKIAPFYKLKGLWPWGEPLTETYSRYMSLQEISTYYRQIKQQFQSIVLMKKNKQMSLQQIRNYEGQVNGTALRIFQESLEMYKNEIQFQTKKQRMWNIYDENTGVIQINHFGWMYLFVTHVPKKFIDNYFAINRIKIGLHDRKKFFASSEGKKIKQKIVILFLKEAQNKVEKYIDEIYQIGHTLLTD